MADWHGDWYLVSMPGNDCNWVRNVPGARPHMPVDRDAPLAEFAARYPAFRVQSTDG